jgi:hypothetical protein
VDDARVAREKRAEERAREDAARLCQRVIRGHLAKVAARIRFRAEWDDIAATTVTAADSDTPHATLDRLAHLTIFFFEPAVDAVRLGQMLQLAAQQWTAGGGTVLGGLVTRTLALAIGGYFLRNSIAVNLHKAWKDDDHFTGLRLNPCHVVIIIL